MAIDLMSSLFKHPGQTAPVKIAPVKPRVRPAKPANGKKFSISFSLISLLSSLSLDREEQLDEELSSTR